MECENCGNEVPKGKVHEPLDERMCYQRTEPRAIMIKRKPLPNGPVVERSTRLTLRRG